MNASSSDHHGALGGNNLMGNPGSTHHSHNPGSDGRINHSSPSKPLATGGGIMNSQTGAMQGSSAGGISGMSTTNGGARQTINNQTAHGKNFPYSVHRKTNSNKLPLIGSNSGKEGSTT